MLKNATFIFVLAGTAYAWPGDASRGREIFQKQQCFLCHPSDGKVVGSQAPDLIHRLGRAQTPSSIAARMWNHAPDMWSAWASNGSSPPALTEADAENLFTYLLAARYFEHRGEARRGKKLFVAKGCNQCHVANGIAKPITEWPPVTDALLLIEIMWNHAAEAKAALQAKGYQWPVLTGQEVTDLVVYVQNMPGRAKPPVELALPSQAHGAQVFQDKGCTSCHQGKEALETRLCKCSVADVAASMWNHADRISPAPPQLDTAEMHDVISYIWADEFFKGKGDPGRGKQKFADRGCAGCHNGSTAPTLTARSQHYSSPNMVAALWKHRALFEKIQTKQIRWARFGPTDFDDICAYLNSARQSASLR